MPSSHTSSMDNNTGIPGSWSASRPMPNEKSSRDARLDKFKNDKDYDVSHRFHSGVRRPKTLDDFLGPQFASLVQSATNKQ